MIKKNSIFFLFVKIYLLVVSIFFLFRGVLLLVEYNRTKGVSTYDLIGAFIMGLRFDIVITGYVAALPFVILFAISLFVAIPKFIKNIVFWYFFILFSITFLVGAADIPFFSQFFSRFNIRAFDWIDSPVFVFQMIIQEPKYWIYGILFILIIILFWFMLKKIFNNTYFGKNESKLYYSIPLFVVSILLIFLGIRGRLDEKSPIRVGTAYFTNNAFINQLGLNPNFTLIRSYLDKESTSVINYMDYQEALKNVRNYLGINSDDLSSGIKKKIVRSFTEKKNYNVVIVLMESMSAHYFDDKNDKNLVPYLKTMGEEGYYFSNFYTAGVHTHNGIFSTIFSFPAIANLHSMKESNMIYYESSIASILKENGYSTIYFTTHDGQFDNVEGFLRNNKFENVITKKDYPSDNVRSTLGVPDDFMFEYSIPIMTGLSKLNKPFLSVYMTASNHGPWIVPDYYKPKSSGLMNQIVEYSDWSIGKFIQLAKKQEWFENTIFVFIADHGAAITNDYDIPLDYVHSPLIIYAPSFIKEHKVFDKISSQIDVAPTILSLLNTSYEKNNMGMDLINETREYAFFNYLGKYGVIDKLWLLILDEEQNAGLYKYTENDKTNYADSNKERVERMKTYLLSHLQVYAHFLGIDK